MVMVENEARAIPHADGDGDALIMLLLPAADDDDDDGGGL